MKKVEVNRNNIWMQTYSGIKFDLEEPTQDMINIVDIAHGLSNICRFGGHTSKFYSVAQHSLTVCAAMRKDGLGKKLCLLGLLHDAHEGYIGDIIQPMKLVLKSVNLASIQNKIQSAIEEKYNLDNIVTEANLKIIEKYDQATLKTEAHSLFDRIVDNWTDSIDHKLKSKVKRCLDPYDSEMLFRKTFIELGGNE